MFKLINILSNKDTQNLKKWLIRYKFHHNIYITIPKDSCPTPISDSWLSLSIPNFNEIWSPNSINSSCVSSAEINQSMGTPYETLPSD